MLSSQPGLWVFSWGRSPGRRRIWCKCWSEGMSLPFVPFRQCLHSLALVLPCETSVEGAWLWAEYKTGENGKKWTWNASPQRARGQKGRRSSLSTLFILFLKKIYCWAAALTKLVIASWSWFKFLVRNLNKRESRHQGNAKGDLATFKLWELFTMEIRCSWWT